MPTYEFRCPDGTIIERVFRMSEAPQAVPAPDGSGMAVRIISGGADLIFKGSGFYITDYGKDGKKDQRDSAKKAEAKGEGAKAESSRGGDAAPAEVRSDAKGDDKGAPKGAVAGDAGGDSAKAARASGSEQSKGGKKPGPSSPSSDAAA